MFLIKKLKPWEDKISDLEKEKTGLVTKISGKDEAIQVLSDKNLKQIELTDSQLKEMKENMETSHEARVKELEENLKQTQQECLNERAITEQLKQTLDDKMAEYAAYVTKADDAGEKVYEFCIIFCNLTLEFNIYIFKFLSLNL